MATGLPGPRREQAEAGGGARAEAEAELRSEGQPGEPAAETHRADTVATDGDIIGGRGGGGGGGGQEGEEDEFGGFMQAGETWEDGFAELHQVSCGKVEFSDKGDMPSWQSDWTDGPSNQSDWTASPSHQSDDSWVAFTQEGGGQARGEEIASGQWWPQIAIEDKADDLNAPRVFLEAFPPVPNTTFDSIGIPTLKQLLRGAAEQKTAPEDYGERSLLDGFQDLNKMFGLKHKRTESPSWKHLLTSLQVDGHLSVGTSEGPAPRS
ncbi:uncharacterized protein si:ch211-14c7.2 isoform X2 [Clupea harengus]|uniref:Uncharacterized protein si:ch211-14c7.2 isoform X2 n=1 Tax=Clupea harengus TaxID=7950 RepID=A0A6P8G2D8_CLUHA|nr:uncharacterized protein si:ch211-14c7.2 isoform X2 [Clupea harengus]